MAFQTILFLLTAWKFFGAVKAGWGDVPIIQLLMRDGTWAFFLLFGAFYFGSGFRNSHQTHVPLAVTFLGDVIVYSTPSNINHDVLYG